MNSGCLKGGPPFKYLTCVRIRVRVGADGEIRTRCMRRIRPMFRTMRISNMKKKEWTFDEFTQVGTDYADIGNVEAYDAKMRKIRDYRREDEQILDALGAGPDHTVLDIGTGTGHLAIAAAARCEKVYAVDVSGPMLEYAKMRAGEKNITNIEWSQCGFLSFDFPGVVFDRVISNAALHHLPDFWKAVAIKRIYDALKSEGSFFLGDVVFSWPVEEADERVGSWLDGMRRVDAGLYSEAATHIRSEYSTFSWILEGLLGRAGFGYRKLIDRDNFIAYLCTK